MSAMTSGTGVIDVSPEVAWSSLTSDRRATLIDVRTVPEWTYVGVADLSSVDKTSVLIEWQVYPSMSVNGGFVSHLTQSLEAAGLGVETPLYFLCRSGVRSKAAAAAMIAAGWPNCFNIAGGFEGGIDAAGHRGALSGWKASGLPWSQT